MDDDHYMMLQDPGSAADALVCDWSTLSAELLAEVCLWLPSSDVAAVRQACSTWRTGSSQAVACVSLGLPGGCRAHAPYGLLPRDTAAATNSLWPATGSLDTGGFSPSAACPPRMLLPGPRRGAVVAPADSSHFHGPTASHGVTREHSLGAVAAASATAVAPHGGLHHSNHDANQHDAHGAYARDGATTPNVATTASAPQEHTAPIALAPWAVPAFTTGAAAAAAARAAARQLPWPQGGVGFADDEGKEVSEVPFQMSFGGLLHVGPQPPPQALLPSRPWSCREAAVRAHKAFPCASKLLISMWPGAYSNGCGGVGAGGLGVAMMQECARDMRDALQLLCNPHVLALTLLGDVPEHLLRTTLPMSDLLLAPLGNGVPQSVPHVHVAGCGMLPQSSAPHVHYLGLGGTLAGGHGVGIVEETEDLDGEDGGANVQGGEEGMEEQGGGLAAALGDCQPMDLDTFHCSSGPSLTAEGKLPPHSMGVVGRGLHGAQSAAAMPNKPCKLPPSWGMGPGSGSDAAENTNQVSNSLPMHHSNNGGTGSGGSGSGGVGGEGGAFVTAGQQGLFTSDATAAQAHQGYGSGPSGSHGSGGSGGTHAHRGSGGSGGSGQGGSHGDGCARQGTGGSASKGFKGSGTWPAAAGRIGAGAAQGSGGDGSNGTGSRDRSEDGLSNRNGSNDKSHSGGGHSNGDGSGANGGGSDGGSGQLDRRDGSMQEGDRPMSHGSRGSGHGGGSPSDARPHTDGTAAAADGKLVRGQRSVGAAAGTDITDRSTENGSGSQARTHVRISVGGTSVPGSSSHDMKSGGSGSEDQKRSGGSSHDKGSDQAHKKLYRSDDRKDSDGSEDTKVPPPPKASTPAAIRSTKGASAGTTTAPRNLHMLNAPSAYRPRAAQPLQLAPGLLPGLVNLRELRLWDCRGLPTPDTLAALTTLPHLQLLDIRLLHGVCSDPGEVLRLHRSSAITDDHLAQLCTITSLTGLHMSHVTQVTGSGLSHLHRLTGLVALSLGSALDAHAVSGDDLKALALALPRLHSLNIGCLASVHQLPGVGMALAPPVAALDTAGGLRSGGQRKRGSNAHSTPTGSHALAAMDALGGLAALGPPTLAGGDLRPWGSCLMHFSGLHTLGLQFIASLEPELVGSLRFLEHLRLLDLEGVDLPYGEILGLLDCATDLPALRRLALTEVVLYDAHLAAMGRLTQLRALTLAQVDVRTRDMNGWTSLSPLSRLASFEFEEWNNPVLSVGNLVVLTDESVCVMAASWRGLEQLRYAGKVVLTGAAREALSGLPRLSHLLIQGTDGTQCIGSRGTGAPGVMGGGSGGAGGGGNHGRGDGGHTRDDTPVVLQACVGSAVLPTGGGTSTAAATTAPPPWLMHGTVQTQVATGVVMGIAEGLLEPEAAEEDMGIGTGSGLQPLERANGSGVLHMAPGPHTLEGHSMGGVSVAAAPDDTQIPATGRPPTPGDFVDPIGWKEGDDVCAAAQQLLAAATAMPATSKATPQQVDGVQRVVHSGVHHEGNACTYEHPGDSLAQAVLEQRAISPAAQLPMPSAGRVVQGRGGEGADGGGGRGGLQVCLLLPHKLSSCNGYLTHSGTPSLNGSQGSEESVNWGGPDGEGGGGARDRSGRAAGEEGEVQGRERVTAAHKHGRDGLGHYSQENKAARQA